MTRIRHKGNSGPGGGAKPPYNGGKAFRLGWPCILPYQMKFTKKRDWESEWHAAKKGAK